MDTHPNWHQPAAEIIRRLCDELGVNETGLTKRITAIHKAHGSLDNWREAKRGGLAA